MHWRHFTSIIQFFLDLLLGRILQKN